MSISGYAIITAMCIGLFSFDIRGIRLHRALHKRGVRTTARCINIAQNEKGLYRLQLQYLRPDGTSYAFKDEPYEFPPVGLGGELEIIYDPENYAAARLVSKLSPRYIPYFMTIAILAFIGATVAFMVGR
ncbi:DUF3592 domain-containing protein [Streptomyces botrytidirepellens]|uniref:DUF3592 domain-containing protein n=1 Tax=Streptomyces botrytidirepellens TaxID=2486417 RepID=UPI001607F1E0|nr:DUF3592 domain-containing protein [Streptomyces botrytidirepellens]